MNHLSRIVSVGILGALVTAPACLTRPVEPVDSRTTSTIMEQLGKSSVDKIDLLLAIDNSQSMADKQDILNLAVPDLVNRLVNPLCVDAQGNRAPTQPSGPTLGCPNGTDREFPAILDIHIGIVDSSLGGHGGDLCPNAVPHDADCGEDATNTTNNDYSHLITRKSPCESPTSGGLGFLAWDPMHSPPGEGNAMNLSATITELVHGTGQIGCGLESQNEGWLRFLVDPAPYAEIKLDAPAPDGKAVKVGRDDALIKERADFLRPDSLLAIVMLTDENDCSIVEGGKSYLFAEDQHGTYHPPLPRQECAKDPADPCCMPCDAPLGACPVDPTCTDGEGKTARVAAADDLTNLRCFDSKRRFGQEFLYPTTRYVNALTQPLIDPTRPDLASQGGVGVANPIFSNLNPGATASNVRGPNLVFLAGIVGVPWQDIARDPSDLEQGFKSAKELGTKDASGATGWDVILGDPETKRPPSDPHMIESDDPRSGIDPVTKSALAPPGSADDADPVNGREWTTKKGDLEYACTFPMLKPHDCKDGGIGCDCDGVKDSPLCAPNPKDGGKLTLQTRAKGYPGVRHLDILKGLGDQGIVASVCAAQMTNEKRRDYGYAPAVGAIIERLKTKLRSQCLPHTLTVDENHHVPCLVLEGRHTEGACSCDASNARQPVATEHEQAAVQAEQEEAGENFGGAPKSNCFCEVPQTNGAALEACQSSLANPPMADGKEVDGWCYVDATTAPTIGDPELVKDCEENDKREIRLVGKGQGALGARLYITCSE